ncbi:MAG: ATP-dependent sacrificial sulfur transferase LarE [Lachnospiraceae bacterium]
MNTIHQKYEALQEILKSYGSVAIAFSSGVDSTFLLRAAHDALGDKVIAVTATSCSFPKREMNEAIHYCEQENIRHILCESEELEIEGFTHNPTNRCYLCKSELFNKILAIAKQEGLAYVAEGSNMDDLGDYRPGLQAVKELGIKSPLREAGLSKEDIRALSKEMNLPTWNKQSFACLSSRFVYGEEISEEKLGMVDQAEQILLDLNFSQVRVRIHDKMARIEIPPSEFAKLLADDLAARIQTEFKKIGFTYVTMDLGGYRTGSMNETLPQA